MNGFMRSLGFSKRSFMTDQRGVVAWLTIVAAVPLTLLMFYMVNSNKAIHEQTRTQDAADMVALVHAAEAARSLNTVSMNQVSMTQAFVAGSTAGSLVTTIYIHDAILIAAIVKTVAYMVKTCKKYLKIPWVGVALAAACAVPSIALLTRLGVHAYRVNSILWEFDPKQAFETASRSVDSLNAKNQDLVDRFPDAVRVASKEIAQSAMVTDYYFDDACADGKAASCSEGDTKRLGMELPIVKNKDEGNIYGYLHFCAAMHFGTPGFEINLGGMVDTVLDGAGAPGVLSGVISSAAGKVMGSLQAVGGSVPITFMNGSYFQRGFKPNKGPFLSGTDEDPNIRDLVDARTGIGAHLAWYYDQAKVKHLFNGLWQPIQAVTEVIETISYIADPSSSYTSTNHGMETPDAGDIISNGSEGLTEEQLAELNTATEEVGVPNTSAPETSTSNDGGARVGKKLAPITYPWEQEEENNVYTWMVNLRTINICAGDPTSSVLGAFFSGGNAVTDFLGDHVFHSLPTVNVYHPRGVELLPKLLQPAENYTDHYKALALVNREPNKYWAPKVFRGSKDKKQSFYKYAQAIVYNREEIGLYSQNWEARLIPATRLQDAQGVVSRMTDDKITDSFTDLKNDLSSVTGEATWGTVVAK